MTSSCINHSRVSEGDIEKRIDSLSGQLTLVEKIDLVNGVDTFDTRPVPRLGVPSLRMADGPMGCNRHHATTFPAGCAMAASWQPDLVQQAAGAIAREVRAKGLNVLLGPCIHIHRIPQGGRNFESFTEDPFLNTKLAVAYITGIQSEGVAACVKHFACNNQEHDRLNVSAEVDRRTLEEIYFPAFKAAVREAGVLAVMGAYNRFNGTHCCENRLLLTDLLKEGWGFDGFVVSDWHAVNDSVAAFNAGCDLEMPGGEYFRGDTVLQAIRDGRLSEAVLDASIRRMWRVMMKLGLFDGPQPEKCLDGRPEGLDAPEHRRLALELARSSMVLLKNEGETLPLEASKIRSIAVIGPHAAVCQTGGGGSSHARPFYAISVFDGIRDIAGEAITVRHEPGVLIEHEGEIVDTRYLKPPVGCDEPHGLLAEYFDNMDLKGEPVCSRVEPVIHFHARGGTSPIDQVKPDFYSIRWSGRLCPERSGDYWLSISSDDGSKLYLDGRQIIHNWAVQSMRTQGALVRLTSGREYDIRIDYFQNTGSAGAKMEWCMVDNSNVLSPAVDLARSSDAAVVCVGYTHKQEAEGWDRFDLSLPHGQDELIRAVAEANPKTIVVLNSGGPVDTRGWSAHVPAILESWYGGQEGGRAVAEILFGRVNPCGKLPFTYINCWEESPAYGNYPGDNFAVPYAEGLYVGYRHFDTRDQAPLYPFGYGLSYTTFAYSDLAVDINEASDADFARVCYTVTNTGSRAGAEVSQVYVRDIESSIDRPFKELKGFDRQVIEPGESRQVVVALDRHAFAFYHPDRNRWEVEPGDFEIMVGASSRDIRLREVIRLSRGA